MPQSLSEEIGSFLDELDGNLPSEDGVIPPAVEPPVVEPPAPEVPPAIVEPPAAEIPAVETPAAEAAPVELTTDEIIASLREQILELTANRGVPNPQGVWPPTVAPTPVAQATPAQEGAPQTPAQPAAPVLPKVGTFQELITAITGNILNDEELDKVIDEPQLINQAIARSNEKTATAILSVIPELVRNESKKQMIVSMAVQEFYSENSDLRPYANYVQYVFAELEQKNKDMTYETLFTTAAETCRKRLGLKNPAAPTPPGRPSGKQENPGFAGSRNGTRRPATGGQTVDPDMADILALKRF